MRVLLAAALVLLVLVPLASGGNPGGLAQLERAIKEELNEGPAGAVARSVRCGTEGGVAQCVVTSVTGVERTVHAPAGDEVGALVWEPLAG